METAIGARIGIDGEKEFSSSLKAITQQLRTLGSELKAVTAEFQDNEDSMEALSAKNDVLKRSINAGEQQLKLLTSQYDRQISKLKELSESLDRATEEFGENSNEAAKAQIAYNKQYKETSNLENQINKTRTSLANMRSQLQKTEREMDDLGDSTDKTADAMEDVDGASGILINGLADLKAGFDMVGGVITSVISGAMDLVTSFFELADATEEFRISQGLLNTAFESAGYSTETAKKAYTDLFAIIGDNDTATETAQLLAKLSINAQDMSTWIDIAAGVAGTFGDALPINSLVEAANETSRVGTVTGVLADALTWVSISEDDFNASLASCSTEAEKNRLIMGTLASAYDTASEAFYRNNETLIESRKLETIAQEAMGELGGGIADLKTKIQSDFVPAMADVVEAFSGVLEAPGDPETKAEFEKSLDSLIDTIDEKLPAYIEAGEEIAEAIADGIVDNLPSLLKLKLKLSPFGMLKKAGTNLREDLFYEEPTIRPFVPENTLEEGKFFGNSTEDSNGTATFNFKVDLDGQTLARSSYNYNQRESTLRGTSFVEVP